MRKEVRKETGKKTRPIHSTDKKVSSKFRLNSISSKFNILISGLLIVVFGVVFLIVGIRFHDSTIEDNQRIFDNRNQATANHVMGIMDKNLLTGMDLQKIIQDMIDEGEMDRQELTKHMGQSLIPNKDAVGIGVAFEANGFDGQDALQIDAQTTDKTGRFIPYVVRNGDQVTMEPIVGVDEGEWYQKPMTTGKIELTEPFIYDGVPMATISLPLFKGSDTVGVVAVDIELGIIQDQLQAVSEDTNYSVIISNSGNIVGHGLNEDIGSKNIKEFDQETAEVLGRMSIGEKFAIWGKSAVTGKEAIKIYTPVKFEHFNTAWTTFSVVEKQTFTGKVNALLWLISGIAVVALIVMIVLISILVKRIAVKPIGILKNSIGKLNDYDFSEAAHAPVLPLTTRQDEIGDISTGLKKMIESISGLIGNIGENSQNVAATAEELTATAQRTTETGEEISRTIEEISRGAGDQANDTEQAAHKVSDVEKLIETEVETIKKLVESTEKIEKEKQEGTVLLAELSTKSEEAEVGTKDVYQAIMENNDSAEKIESASEMIQSIADQTNLLALNAAIEAARAGESGKGFAVVADEIRKLAEQSTEFTKEIKSVIGQLKNKSGQAVDIVSNNRKIVQKQMESVKSTSSKFDIISAAIEDTKGIVTALERSTKQMEERKAELVTIIMSLSAIAEENAASTQEAYSSMEEQTSSMHQVTGASENLAEIADELQHLIDRFKV